jgi:hypothetical protein
VLKTVFVSTTLIKQNVYFCPYAVPAPYSSAKERL